MPCSARSTQIQCTEKPIIHSHLPQLRCHARPVPFFPSLGGRLPASCCGVLVGLRQRIPDGYVCPRRTVRQLGHCLRPSPTRGGSTLEGLRGALTSARPQPAVERPCLVSVGVGCLRRPHWPTTSSPTSRLVQLHAHACALNPMPGDSSACRSLLLACLAAFLVAARQPWHRAFLAPFSACLSLRGRWASLVPLPSLHGITHSTESAMAQVLRYSSGAPVDPPPATRMGAKTVWLSFPRGEDLILLSPGHSSRAA
ncbi:hypothetical protein B0T18DRAFT_44656 [Schizothecium vesticola]|uniref:Uncharacterized protein n=1 Tax=Schizothecium vesticola TaxID=314040 RepID=A0AA40FCE0_9PEZI|nr:hypothetical protein B0T18DRAFT_44656 [Schizothecium vesticola]